VAMVRVTSWPLTGHFAEMFFIDPIDPIIGRPLRAACRAT
jgi:hypothetical protein